MPIRVAIDAMGGDFAPAEPVAGALQALRVHDDVELAFVGAPDAIETELARATDVDALQPRFRVVEAPGVVGMNDDPVRTIRSDPTCSARVCAELLSADEVDGVVNMGSTGAAVAAATLYCRRLQGVKRTGIAVPFPRREGATIVIDGGANPDARPSHLHQYAAMGSEYVRAAFDTASPKIGILSIGEEEHKGNRMVEAAWEAFRANPVPGFIGNVEPRQLFTDYADVVVADGFVGNIALKSAEAMAEFVLAGLAPILAKIKGINPKEILASMIQSVDYSEYGGAPLLGVRGGYMIGHGRSRAHAFTSAVGAIRKFVLGRVSERIVERLANDPPADLRGAAS